MKKHRIFPQFPRTLHRLGCALGMALPIMGQSALTAAVQLTDGLMLSRVGQTQLAAASLAGQYMTLYQLCAMALGTGTGVLTARFHASGNLRNVHRAVTLLWRMELLLAAVFGLPGTLFPENILRLFTADDRLISAGAGYLRLLWPSYFPLAISQGCSAVLRSVGRVNAPLLAGLLGFAVNFTLNLLLIFGHWGLPALGIAGAALGTDAARWAEGLAIGGYFFFRDQTVGYGLRNLRMRCGGLTREYLRICLPVLVSDGLLGLGNTVSAAIFGQMGGEVAAGSAVTLVVQQLSGVLHHGIAGAAGIVIGRSLGRENREAAQTQGWGFALLGGLVGLAATGLTVLVRLPLLRAYGVSPAAEEAARQIFTGMCLTLTARCLSGTLTKGVLRAGGDTAFVLAVDLGGLWLLSLPAASLWALVHHGSPLGTYVLLQADQFLKCFLCLWRLHSKKWMKRIFGCA